MDNGIATIKCNQTKDKECYMNFLQKITICEVNRVIVDIEMIYFPKEGETSDKGETSK